MQKSTMIFVALCLVFLIVLSGYTWWRKVQINQIPKLLYKMDGMLRTYVDQYNPKNLPITQNELVHLAEDLGELFHIAIYPLGNALKKGDRKAISTQTRRYNSALNTSTDVKNRKLESLKQMMQISALMNEYNIGLKTIKDTPHYKMLFDKVSLLERIQPNPDVSIKIDAYFRWSDGYYSQLMGMKFITSQPEIFQTSPAEYRATAAYARPVFEDQVDVLIAQVSESLQNNKRKSQEKKNGE
jgi:hypothetical protein